MSLPQSVIDLVETGRLAHFTTINPDGSPQTTVVWIGYEDGEIVSGHMGEYQKMRNVRRDPRVTVSFLGSESPTDGLHPYVVINGTAHIAEGGALALLRRLAKVYLGTEATFLPDRDDPEAGLIIRITPDSIGGVGPWSRR